MTTLQQLAVAFCTLLFFTFAAPAAAAEVSMLHLAQRKNSEGDPHINLIGAFAFQGGTAAHFDLVQYKDEVKGEAWSFEFAAGYLLPTQVHLYAGAGMVAGYRRRGGEFFGAYYPEIGIMIPVSQGIGLTASTKRYVKLFKEVENVVMFGIVLTEK